MNVPWVYTCSPSWTLPSPLSPYHPAGSSQCTSPEHPVSCIEPGLAIHFIYDIIHVSMPFSHIIPPSPSPSPTESKRLFYTSVSLLLSHIQGWKIPWTEEPGRLQSMGSLGVGRDWVTSLSLFTFMHWRRKWQPTPVFLPGESQGWGSLVGCRLWGCTESDTTEVTWQQQQQNHSNYKIIISHALLFPFSYFTPRKQGTMYWLWWVSEQVGIIWSLQEWWMAAEGPHLGDISSFYSPCLDNQRCGQLPLVRQSSWVLSTHHLF